MEKIYQKHIVHLNDLLRSAEQKGDLNSASALRWAIYQCEQKLLVPAPGDLMLSYALKTEQERNEIIDTGSFNEIIKGYLVIALRGLDRSSSDIRDALSALDSAFDDANAAQARKACREMSV